MTSRRRAARRARAAAERSDAARCACDGVGVSRRRRERSDRAMAAECHGSGRLHLQAKRAASDSERRRQGSSPEGRRPRQRASWSRAGRSRARRNRARRPVPGPGGRSDHPGGREDDIERSSTTTANEPRRERDATGRTSCGVGCGSRETVPPSVRRRRASAEPDARRWRRIEGWRCSERKRRRREAPRREARHRARRKKGADPSPKRGPALTGSRCAALTRRRCGPGCRAGGPCRRGSR